MGESAGHCSFQRNLLLEEVLDMDTGLDKQLM